MNAPAFEHVKRGGREAVRVAVAEYRGRRHLDVRLWLTGGDTDRATKQGITLPLERIGELAAALATIARNEALHGPENGS